MLNETRARSYMLLCSLFERCEERGVEWVVKEGGVLAAIRRVREKEERNVFARFYACWAAGELLGSYTDQIRGVREEWKGTKEWREAMWMMEEEGEIDSLCGRAKADGGGWAEDVLRELGICYRN
jgi:hypothetical protein